MKCYDCGGLIAPGADKCPACNCPAERAQAVKCLETRLLTARVEAESALDQLGGRRSRCSAPRFSRLSAAWSCWCMPGATRRCWPSGIFMAALACVYAALAFLVRESSAGAFDRGISAQLALSRRVARSGDRRGHGAESLVRRAVCPHYEPCRIVGTKNR